MRKLGLFFLLLVVGCSSSTSASSSLVGSWITANTTVSYSADNTFIETVTDASSAVIQTVKGTYSTNGSTLTVISTEATPTVAGLPITLTFTYVLSGNSLTETATADGSVRKYVRKAN